MTTPTPQPTSRIVIASEVGAAFRRTTDGRVECAPLAEDNATVLAEYWGEVDPSIVPTLPGSVLARLAAASVTTEPERIPCDTQDTVAAALIPGDVVLGPDGWVIVADITNVTALYSVRITPENRAPSFLRAYEAVVAVQPDADTQSSASRQHFIETGRYLRRVDAADMPLGCGCPGDTPVRQASEHDVECTGCGFRSA